MPVRRQAIARDRGRRERVCWRFLLQIVAFTIASFSACTSSNGGKRYVGDNHEARGNGETGESNDAADRDDGDATTPPTGVSGSLSPPTGGSA